MLLRIIVGVASIMTYLPLHADQKMQTGDGIDNPSVRPLAAPSTYGFFGDLLAWSAQESGSENWAEVITASGSTEHADVRDVRFNWNAGFRAGFTYGMKHDSWDTEFYYTWFRTRGDDRVSSTPGTVFSSFLGNFYVNNQNGAGISGIAYQRASVNWKIRFNMFDGELGKNFWISKALALRPFIGVKGGWIHQSIHTKWHNPTLSSGPFFNTARENLKNNFWGVGPSFGLNTRWSFATHKSHMFSLLGDLSGAIMWGHWKLRDVYKNKAQQEVVVKLSHINSAAFMLRTFLGLGWDTDFSQDRFHFSAKAGCEMQFWLDQLQFYSFDAGRLDNALTLQGGTLELRFDF